MNNNETDVLIIGAGIMGSSTAYHMAKRGVKPLVLEQFSQGHSRGSSHGHSRIIRYAHGDSTYLPIMKESYALWDELEKATGVKLISKCGLLWLSKEVAAKNCSRILKEHGVNHRLLEGHEVQKEFPQFRYDDNWFGLVDPEGGVLYADKCLKAVQDLAQKFGAKFKFEETVKQLQSEKGAVVVVTDKGVYKAKKVVVTVGGWLNQVLPDLHDTVETQAEQVAVDYWKVERNPEFYDNGNCPTVVIEESEDILYMLPPVDYPGHIKFCLHAGEPIDPNKPLSSIPDWLHEAVKNHIAEHLPDIDGSKPAIVDNCIYTVTKDTHYVIGSYPGDSRILVGGGFSGSGFKLSISMGRILADLANGRNEEEVVPDLFKVKRKRLPYSGW